MVFVIEASSMEGKTDYIPCQNSLRNQVKNTLQKPNFASFVQRKSTNKIAPNP